MNNFLTNGKRSAPPPRRAHPLKAIALPGENVEWHEAPDGKIHLRGHFPRRGFAARIFGSEKLVQAVLDDRGSFFWSLLDGQRDLLEIAGRLASRFSLDTAASREATVLFVKMLMRRGLLRLQLFPAGVPDPAANTPANLEMS